MALIPNGESQLINAYMYGGDGVYLDSIDLSHLNSALRSTAGSAPIESQGLTYEHGGRHLFSLGEMRQHIGEPEWGMFNDEDDLERVRYYLELKAFIDCQGELTE